MFTNNGCSDRKNETNEGASYFWCSSEALEAISRRALGVHCQKQAGLRTSLERKGAPAFFL